MVTGLKYVHKSRSDLGLHLNHKADSTSASCGLCSNVNLARISAQPQRARRQSRDPSTHSADLEGGLTAIGLNYGLLTPGKPNKQADV
jgi:hypothetical protein